MEEKTLSQQEEEHLHLQVLKKVYDLLTSALSLVAALAWNDAIQSLFSAIFGKEDTLVAKFLYAVFLTAIIVWFSSRLARVTRATENRLRKQNK